MLEVGSLGRRAEVGAVRNKRIPTADAGILPGTRCQFDILGKALLRRRDPSRHGHP
jgi:hypothetical protein